MDGVKSVEIKGYPKYLIYEDGKVYSNKTNRFLKQCFNRGGYLILNLCKDGKPKSHRVHRLVAEHFLSANKELTDVNHIDGVKTNNNINNLEWSNKSLNGLHAFKLGLNKCNPCLGEKHGLSKLTESDILGIRSMFKEGNPRKIIAKKYSISLAHVCRIVNRETWIHI